MESVKSSRQNRVDRIESTEWSQSKGVDRMESTEGEDKPEQQTVAAPASGWVGERAKR